MIECSFFLSVVGLAISVLISYSKWMYHHFSLAIGRPKKWHIRAFEQYTKDRDTNTDTGVIFLFFLYKSVFDQISTKFRRNSTNFRPIVVVDQTS